MARKFNGTNSWYFRTGLSMGARASSPLTLLCWINPSSLAADGNLILLGSNTNNTDLHRLIINITTGEIGAASRQGASTEQFATTSGATPSTGSWSCAAGVWVSATDRRSFWGKPGLASPIKGTNTTSAAPAAPLVNLGVGARQTGTVEFNGHLAHVTGWRIALTDPEITAMTQGQHPLSMHPEQIIFYYPLLDGAQALDQQQDFGPLRDRSLLPTNAAAAPTVPTNGPTGQTVADPPVQPYIMPFLGSAL